jgi:hypothetical protein
MGLRPTKGQDARSAPHSCVACSHSCEHRWRSNPKRSHECERGTQECVRHERVT